MTNRDWCRFNDGLYGLPVRRREGHAPPLQGRCGRRSTTNATACMALRERRYRRNRCIPLSRRPVRAAAAFPRLPRPLWGLAMTNRDWCPFNDGLYGLPVRRRERHAAPLQREAGGQRILHNSFFICPAPTRARGCAHRGMGKMRAFSAFSCIFSMLRECGCTQPRMLGAG